MAVDKEPSQDVRMRQSSGTSQHDPDVSTNGTNRVSANGSAQHQVQVANNHMRYLHITAVHTRERSSCLSHDSKASPSFLGFRNLMVIVLIVMNLRLVVENFMKYGVLICFHCHDYSASDVTAALVLFAMVPLHLLVAFIIESAAANEAMGVMSHAKKMDGASEDITALAKALRATWRRIARAHGVNATLCLLITSCTVYYGIHHPLIGTISEVHAIIVWLKICSYAFTNRDLRYALLKPAASASLPAIYASCPYPRNITLGNLSYFWWAPTLVYQPVYPRSSSIRWLFVFKRLAETFSLSIFIWLASAQYAAPLLHNSLPKMSSLDLPSILERLMKLSTVSLVIWLAGFFAVFQSLLNALAEVMRFGDREFYTEWWNSPSVGMYWRTWNKPVTQFMRRHIYAPLIGRGWGPSTASTAVFMFSGVLHELLVGIPTHNVLGVAFLGMIIQIPMIIATLPLEKMQGVGGKILGNCVFWISFCLVGQPLAALLYYFAWQAKYGSVSKQRLG